MATCLSEKARFVKVGLATMFWWFMISSSSVFNKEFSSGRVCVIGSCFTSFPYPMATAFMQLGFVGALLFLGSIINHLFRNAEESWVCGPHLTYKLKHVAPVGLSFGTFMSLNHWGLSLVPMEMHVLLVSTSLLWAVVLARIINKERLDVLESSAVLLVSIGAVVISLDSTSQLEGSALGLVVNWMAAFFQALYLNLLRKGIAELSRSDNSLHGSMSPFEFTAFKCVLSSAVVFIMSFVFECQSMREAEGQEQAQSWWDALVEYPSWSLCLGALGGGFILLGCQVTITWIAELTSATTVAVLAEVAVVPQWLFSMLFFTPDFGFIHVIGAAIEIVGTIVYVVLPTLPTKLAISSHGFEWQSRNSSEENATDAKASSTQKKESETGTP